MLNTGKLAGRTLFITGASRGIGKEIALKAAKDGANIVIAAKSAEAHPKLPGTIFTACKEIEDVGGKCLPCKVDIRDESQVQEAVHSAVKKFGGIDILVNNASAISLTGTLETDMKKYDLMHSINTRGTYLVSKLCLPYLKSGNNPHILNISPPLNMRPRWFENHVAYTMAKYGMSMCVLGMSEEFKKDGIAVNALWPRTAIYTAAMKMLGGGSDEIAKQCRSPEIMADSAYVVLTRDSRSFTGKFYIDEDVLKEEGVNDFEKYSMVKGSTLLPDFFLEDETVADLARTVGKPGSTGGDAAPSSGGGKVAGVFEKISGFLTEDLVKGTNAIYQFDVKGEESGTWHLDLKSGSGSCGQGTPINKADCTFIMDSNDFFKMFSGSLKPTAAFMSGKLKLKGDMGKAMKLEKLMGKLKSKL